MATEDPNSDPEQQQPGGATQSSPSASPPPAESQPPAVPTEATSAGEANQTQADAAATAAQPQVTGAEAQTPSSQEAAPANRNVCPTSAVPAAPVVVAAQEPRRPSFLLTMAALVLLLWAAALVWRDYTATMGERGGRAEALRIAEEALKHVQNPDNGWFPAAADPLFSWDQSTQDWEYEAGSPGTPSFSKGASENAGGDTKPAPETEEKLRIVAAEDSGRGNALRVPVHFPDPATLYRETAPAQGGDPTRLQGTRFIAYDVLVPRGCPGYVGCLLFLKDKDGLWYQARTRAALVPGTWTTVTADIRGESPDVTPLGHLGQWDENQATKVRMLGITFYGDKDYDGYVLLDNLRGWLRAPRFQQMVASLGGPNATPVSEERKAALRALVKAAESCREEPLEIINLRTIPAPGEGANGSAPVVRRFDTLTVCFELTRQVDNPFDPEKADIRCVVKTPSGQNVEHVGFWYQDYDRGERFADDELKPIGRPEWRVRITPREAGEHTYQLRVKLKDEALELPARPFACTPSDGKGFIRVARNDRRFLETETGSFFYPIGHNISTPVDIRCWREIFHKEPPAGRGLAMYMDFFDKMQANKENTVEVWMASWWVGIEWTGRWKDYCGATRYSLQHAWKLDYLLNLARTHGLYVHLVIDNHGKFSQWCDWEWENNPYNSRSRMDNGIVPTAEDFFSHPTARKWHKNKLRYLAARWGAEPAILGWELVSEYDLVGGLHNMDKIKRLPYPRGFHCSPTLQNWAREMIGHLRECDPYAHPVTNHYATDYSYIDVQLARDVTPEGRPLLDYVATDAYGVERPYTVKALKTQQWVTASLPGEKLKPFWITEYGGDFNVGVPHAGLVADVHCGLWSTWMTDGMGTPLFWWYDFVELYDLYKYYRAFANFVEGEDRRGLAGTMAPLPLAAGNAAEELQGRVYRWPSGAYAWVFNAAAMDKMPTLETRPAHAGVEAGITGLEAGKYRVEYWDCLEGKVLATDAKEIGAGQPVQLKFPTFKVDCAVKVKKQ